jgi:hypothetical protein
MAPLSRICLRQPLLATSSMDRGFLTSAAVAAAHLNHVMDGRISVRETHSVLKNGHSFRERIQCCPARGSVSFSPKKMAEHLKKADSYGHF